MVVVSGKQCSLVVANSMWAMPSARLLAPPTAGRVTIRGGRVTYIARQGYVGDDRFTFIREGTDEMNQPASWTVEINVQVKERL
jgi:hypothetical protein